MKQALSRARRGLDVRFREVDIERDPELLERYGEQIPVLFVNGAKAFKHRATEEELRARLLHEVGKYPPVSGCGT